jgi:alkaline phosphatase D
MPVSEMDGEVSGAFGEVKIILKSKNHSTEVDWTFVSSFNDYTYKKNINGLKPNTKYEVELLGRKFKGRKNKPTPKATPITSIKGSFTTAPDKNTIAPVTFTTSTCQYFWDYDDAKRGFKAYDAMKREKPLFHCQTGDYVYYDKGPNIINLEQARFKWHAINAWPSISEFHADVPLYIQKDDHDLLSNDSHPEMDPFGELTFEDGLKIWYEQVPLIGKPYRTFRWGKDLQIWLLEGREYRSNNWTPDDPNKTILGKKQIQWFKETVETSDATFKIVLSATPVVGPDRGKDKSDNHANAAFKTEGSWLRKFMTKNNIYSVTGDRHWQYLSKDKETGLLELCPGATSDEHAQGWSQDDKREEHKFLRVAGGFATIKVYRKKNKSFIELIHHDVDGNVVNSVKVEKK